jgi:hypothetical protein
VLGFDEPVTVRATVAGRETASAWRSREHSLVLQAPEGTEQEILLESTNEAGLVRQHGSLRGVWPSRDAPAPREEQASALPAGFWLGQAGDWDLDGHPETVVAPWTGDREQPGPARAYRLAGGDWLALDHAWGSLLPRGYGDTDGDGRGELLLGAGGRCELWESTGGGLPDRLAWSSDDHWAANLLKMPALGPDPLLLLAENTSARRFSLWRCAPDPSGDRDPRPERLFELPSPWESEPRLQGPPQGILADTDGVEGPELWLADRSGHLFAYAFEGGQARLRDSLSFADTEGPGAWLVAVPGEPRDRLALLLHDPSPDTESAAAARVWQLLLLGRSGENGPLVEQDSRLFLGVQDGPGFHNGLVLWNPDGPSPELALLLAPRAYSIGLETQGLGAVRQLGEGLSGATLLALDGNGDGGEQLWLPRAGSGAAGSLHWRTAEQTGPLPPLWSPESGPLDENRIRLAWRFPDTPPEEVVIRVGGDRSPIACWPWIPTLPCRSGWTAAWWTGRPGSTSWPAGSGGSPGPSPRPAVSVPAPYPAC